MSRGLVVGQGVLARLASVSGLPSGEVGDAPVGIRIQLRVRPGRPIVPLAA